MLNVQTAIISSDSTQEGVETKSTTANKEQKGTRKAWDKFKLRCANYPAAFPTDFHLTNEHANELAASGISPTDAAKSGIHSRTGKDCIEVFGISSNPLTPKDYYLVYPYFDFMGDLCSIRWKDGSSKKMPFARVKCPVGEPKYLTPFGALSLVYIPVVKGDPREGVGEDKGDLILITEGEKKAIRTCLTGVPCVGLPGVDLKKNESFFQAMPSPDIWRDLLGVLLRYKKQVLCWDNDQYSYGWNGKAESKIVNKRAKFTGAAKRLFTGLTLAQWRDEPALSRNAIGWNADKNIWDAGYEMPFSSEKPLFNKLNLHYILLPATQAKMGLDDLLQVDQGEDCLRELLLHTIAGVTPCYWEPLKNEGHKLKMDVSYRLEPPIKADKAAKGEAGFIYRFNSHLRPMLIKWSGILNNWLPMGREIYRYEVVKGEPVYTPFDYMQSCLVSNQITKDARKQLGWSPDAAGLNVDGYHIDPHVTRIGDWLKQGDRYQVFSDCMVDLKNNREKIPLAPKPGLLKFKNFPVKVDLVGDKIVAHLMDNFFQVKEEGSPNEFRFQLFMSMVAHIIEGNVGSGLKQNKFMVFQGEPGTGKTALIDFIGHLVTSEPISVSKDLTPGSAGSGVFPTSCLGNTLLVANDVKGMVSGEVVTLINNVCDNMPVPTKTLFKDVLHTPLGAKLLFSCNKSEMKFFTSNKGGLYRRIVILDFDRQLGDEQGNSPEVATLAELVKDPQNLSDFYRHVEMFYLENDRYKTVFAEYKVKHLPELYKELVEDDLFIQWLHCLKDEDGEWDATMLNKEGFQVKGDRWIITHRDAMGSYVRYIREVGSKGSMLAKDFTLKMRENGCSFTDKSRYTLPKD